MKHSIILTLLFIIACEPTSQLEKANTLKNSSIELIKAKSYTEAIDSALMALDIYQKEKDKAGQAETLFHLARASAMSGDFSQAKDYGRSGASLAREQGNLSLEYKINNIVSWSYFSLGMGFEETIDHQRRQLEVVNQLDNEAAKAMVYNNYGYDATVSGLVLLDSAIHYMKWANDYYAKAENTHGRWYTLMNLCWQHRLKNNLETSKAYGLHSLSQAKADSNRHAIIEAATNLSETLIAQQKLKDAEKTLLSIKELANEETDRDKYVYDIYYAHYLGASGRITEAIKLLQSTITFLESGEIFYEMLARAYLARYAHQNNQLNLAGEQLDVFDNPRASYFSMEAKVFAAITKAEVEGNKTLLDPWVILSKKIGADYLLYLIESTT